MQARRYLDVFHVLCMLSKADVHGFTRGSPLRMGWKCECHAYNKNIVYH